MAHSKSRHQQALEHKWELAQLREQGRPRRERAIREAKLSVAAWNVRVVRGLPIVFFPKIWAAIVARRPFLTCLCPGCQVRGSVDLRKFKGSLHETVDILIPALSCQRCRPNAPHVHITGLRKRPPEKPPPSRGTILLPEA